MTGARDQDSIALRREAGKLTIGEVLREGRGARERAEGRLGVDVERVPDADRYRRVLARRWGCPRAGLGLRGAGAVAGARARGCGCRGGEGCEGSGEEGEELHDDDEGGASSEAKWLGRLAAMRERARDSDVCGTSG